MGRVSTFWGTDRWMRERVGRAASVWALVWVIGLCCWTFAPTCAWAQDAQPVKLIELIGPRAVFDGEVVNYRARVDDASTKPVGFLWDFGDGIASEGTLVAHRYRTPGVYTVTLVAYNTAGRDTLRARIRVTERPEDPAPTPAEAAPARSAPRATSTTTPKAAAPTPISRAEVREQLFGHTPIQPATTGYTWILVSDLWNERIQRTLLQYRLQGIRVEIMEETQGRGSRAYRIIAGHFPTIGQALMARAMLNLGDQTAMLHSFAPDGLKLAVADLPGAIRQLPQRDRRWINNLSRLPEPLVADAQSTAPDAGPNTEPGISDATPSREETNPGEADPVKPNPVEADPVEAANPTVANRESDEAETRSVEPPGAEPRNTETNATASASSPAAGAARVAITPPVATTPARSPPPTGFPAWVWIAVGVLASMTGGVAAFLWYGLSGTEPVDGATAEDNTHDPPPADSAKKAWPPIVLPETDRRRLPIQHRPIQHRPIHPRRAQRPPTRPPQSGIRRKTFQQLQPRR